MVINDNQVAIWNDCARIIANAIIYYNSVILSNLLHQFEKKKNSKAFEAIKRTSPVAWQNVNLNGSYHFNANQSIDLDGMLQGVEPNYLD